MRSLDNAAPNPTDPLTETDAGPSSATVGRPRSEQTRTAVLDAATVLLSHGGLAALTVEAISARARIAKPTIYRRWPNRTAIAIDAFAERMAHQVPVADTGDPRADLIEQVRRVAEFYTTDAGNLLAQLLAATTLDPPAATQLRDRFFAGRRAQTTRLWQRAVDRGAVRADVTADTAIDILFGPIVFRLLVGPVLDPDEATALAETALAGLSTPP